MSATDFLDLWHNLRGLVFVAILVTSIIVTPRWFPGWNEKSHQSKSTNLTRQNTQAKRLNPKYQDLDNFSNSITDIGISGQESSGRSSRVRKQTTVPQKDQKFSLQLTIFFSSISGTTQDAAKQLEVAFSESLKESLLKNPSVELHLHLVDLSDCEYDDYFLSPPTTTSKRNEHDVEARHFYIILTPTYNIDTYIDTFIEYLREAHYDFRVDTGPLSRLIGYAVFGFGDKTTWPTEEAGYCRSAISIDKWLAKLTGGKRAYPVGMGDVRSNSMDNLSAWRKGVESILCELAASRSLGVGIAGSGNAVESDEEMDDDLFTTQSQPPSSRPKSRRSPIGDLEDIGRTFSRNTSSVNYEPTDYTTGIAPNLMRSSSPEHPKEMVPRSSPTYAALTKQGYSIVGSHSGVKICRWTKSALRGRGSCYKYSFYGIKSHLCMEATPSLSCSNKCVFCWRHGTNPVGTTWRWQVDPPDKIFEGIKAGHYQKIKMMRGVPGVRAERFEEAMRIRHCALSLVGEPIFYPHINAFTSLLHNERISTFLVCNAQHPEQLAALTPVTQLYVSIDASNRDSLRKIDRPLHRDFWERFCRCLDIIHAKRFQQRTVFRLTLVKGFNIEGEAEGYADLIVRGLPCFVEVKGVTYCGTTASAGAGLTMQNVPFYEEVCAFVTALDAALTRRGLEYGIAAEHAHSCCVLIASKRFFLQGRWNTLINYDAFFKCLESGEDFTPEDYCAETPEWALWGNGGFDPADVRVHRKGKKSIVAS